MENPFDTVPEADRLEQDLPADPASAPARPAPEADSAWDAPEADRFEQLQPVAALDDDLWRAGGAETGWDAPEADRLEQATAVVFDDEDRDELVDEAVEDDR